MSILATDAGVELAPDPGRAIARLFLPGESTPGGEPRTEGVLARVLATSPDAIAAEAWSILDRFGARHDGLVATLRANAAAVRAPGAPDLDDDMAIVVGAAFTAEYSVEGTALCNPSAVAHPDQSGLAPGQLRVMLSLRSIGEPHLSSVQFCEAVIGPGRRWEFLPRQAPLSRAVVSADADSSYRAVFDPTSGLSTRVLFPVTDEESHGIEDVRLVAFEHDGGREYRGTFTAYDGGSIASKLLTTTDFREFAVRSLTGPPAWTKGMALFPRLVGGMHLALGRTDGESLGLARSPDGLDWSTEEPLHGPDALWEVVQSGNCGPPIETAAGWLVLTHGVAPMRVYSIGAILLELADPSHVIGVLPGPLVEPSGLDGGGYVPNVVYSCGGIVHDGVLWIPHGVDDARIRVVSVELDALLAAMRPPSPSTWIRPDLSRRDRRPGDQ
ncbi:glycoside hydrolase family 130 protein [Gryllotalpicola sp.]|uniref:glycoside hydrolase family 130 protein n=1 Tax=Gryllotalpicola sp. TaxID=1932787 RepID=UPI00262F2B68|nr:glycoside hydrolase family 130 protein [Gryllotalpicola sp.]